MLSCYASTFWQIRFAYHFKGISAKLIHLSCFSLLLSIEVLTSPATSPATECLPSEIKLQKINLSKYSFYHWQLWCDLFSDKFSIESFRQPQWYFSVQTTKLNIFYRLWMHPIWLSQTSRIRRIFCLSDIVVFNTRFLFKPIQVCDFHKRYSAWLLAHLNVSVTREGNQIRDMVANIH